MGYKEGPDPVLKARRVSECLQRMGLSKSTSEQPGQNEGKGLRSQKTGLGSGEEKCVECKERRQDRNKPARLQSLYVEIYMKYLQIQQKISDRQFVIVLYKSHLNLRCRFRNPNIETRTKATRVHKFQQEMRQSPQG